MVCVECRDSRHSGCENLKRLGVATPATGQFCDCQHQPHGCETADLVAKYGPEVLTGTGMVTVDQVLSILSMREPQR